MVNFTENLVETICKHYGLDVSADRVNFSGMLYFYDRREGMIIAHIPPRAGRSDYDLCAEIVAAVRYYKNQLDMWSGKSPNVYS